MKDTTIAWTGTQTPDGEWHLGNTFNCWRGCEHKIEDVDGRKVEDPACKGCYAEGQQDKRWHQVEWGPGKPRIRTSEKYWKQPYTWNEEAETQGFPTKVFCASLADWLDAAVPIEWFADLMQVVSDNRNLIWMMLTKRPENWAPRLQHAIAELPDHPAREFMQAWLDGEEFNHIWVGVTVTTQEFVDRRCDYLIKIPAVCRFLSCEPMTEPITIWHWLMPIPSCQHVDRLSGCCEHADNTTSECRTAVCPLRQTPKIHMVVAGGASDSHIPAPEFHLEWATWLQYQVIEPVAFFFKQLGSRPVYRGQPYPKSDRKGEVLSEAPEHLQVRQFPDLTQFIVD